MPDERVLKRQVGFLGITGWMRKEKVISERDILQSVKKGDREAYGVIVTRYMKTAYYIALGFEKK